MLSALSEALEQMGPRLRLAYKFDFQNFLYDVMEAIARCPATIGDQLI